MNNIIIKCLSAAPALVLAAGTAFAQDLTAGKTPAQLFAADCSACHRSPHGLGKKYNTGSLTGFLRTHYTTTQETAGSLAKYVMAPRPVATTSPTAKDQTWREPTELVEELNRTLRGWANYFEAGTRLPDGKRSSDGEKPARSHPTPRRTRRWRQPARATRGWRRDEGSHCSGCAAASRRFRGAPPRLRDIGSGCGGNRRRRPEAGVRQIASSRRRRGKTHATAAGADRRAGRCGARDRQHAGACANRRGCGEILRR